MNQEIRNATIQQINIAFHPVEDRLLLKIGFAGDAEIAIWLTRRVVKGLWQLLQGDDLALHAPMPAEGGAATPAPSSGAVSNTTSGISKKLDFDSEYKPRTLVNEGGILLAKDSHILRSANQQASLEFLCSNGQTIKLGLTPDLVQAFISMLMMVSKETAWELPQTMHAPLMTAIQTSTVLH
jgi:hypothetical protein